MRYPGTQTICLVATTGWKLIFFWLGIDFLHGDGEVVLLRTSTSVPTGRRPLAQDPKGLVLCWTSIPYTGSDKQPLFWLSVRTNSARSLHLAGQVHSSD